MENEHSPISQTVKSVKVTTSVSPLPVKVDHIFAEASNSCDNLRGNYSISWQPVYFESLPRFQV
jgi:hypothetical protein